MVNKRRSEPGAIATGFLPRYEDSANVTKICMNELDFINFGVDPDNRELENRIQNVFSILDSFGDLRLRAALLYYGDISEAAKAFGVSSEDFRARISPAESQYESKLDRIVERQFASANIDIWIDFGEMADFIKILPDDERSILFSRPLDRNQFSNLLNSWKIDERLAYIESATDLVRSYALKWHRRKLVRPFFSTLGVDRWMKDRKSIAELSSISFACSIATEIFQEYDIYLYHWNEVQKFKKQQKSYASSHRAKFIDQVIQRDGSDGCRFCGSKDRIQLDHIIATSHGGMSTLENFQILCTPCNKRKAYNERAIIHGGRLRS